MYLCSFEERNLCSLPGTEKGKFVNENAWGCTTQDKLCSLLMTNHTLQQKAFELIAGFEFQI